MTEHSARKRARSTIQEVGSLMTQCTVCNSDNINNDNYRYFYYDSDNNSVDNDNFIASL